MLKASDLRNVQKERRRATKGNYKKLLDDCCNRLKVANAKGSTSYIYRLNSLIVDMPLIDVTQALMYIAKRLKESGFKVTFASSNAILIDWTRG